MSDICHTHQHPLISLFWTFQQKHIYIYEQWAWKVFTDIWQLRRKKILFIKGHSLWQIKFFHLLALIHQPLWSDKENGAKCGNTKVWSWTLDCCNTKTYLLTVTLSDIDTTSYDLHELWSSSLCYKAWLPEGSIWHRRTTSLEHWNENSVSHV